MRLFLTYLWVGGAVLYTLNTVAYTYLGEPARETSVSQRAAPMDKAPRKVASWGSHLAADSDRSSARSAPGEIGLPSSGAPVSSGPSPRDVVPAIEKDVAAINDIDPDTVADIDRDIEEHDSVEEEDTASSPNGIADSENTSSRPPGAADSKTPADPGRRRDNSAAREDTVAVNESKATPEQPKNPMAASPAKDVPKKPTKTKRQLYAPVAEAIYPAASESRSSKRTERRADRAGLGLFRFGPQGF